MPRGSLLRIPCTDPLPAPRIIPTSATTARGAVAALVNFLSPCLPSSSSNISSASRLPLLSRQLSNTLGRNAGNAAGKTLLLTGAGISVASGLADYRGTNGTYTLNKTYRPIYYNEFCESHETRKRYWARSFIGWTNLERARANATHVACGDLGRLGVVGKVVTQSMFFTNISPSPLLSWVRRFK
jgi:NAD-dependent deacetylase sirtuin 4